MFYALKDCQIISGSALLGSNAVTCLVECEVHPDPFSLIIFKYKHLLKELGCIGSLLLKIDGD